MMARLLVGHGVLDDACQLLVAAAFAYGRVQIVLAQAEQARPNLAVAGEPDARARAAEGKRDRSDDAELADSVVKAVAPRGRAGFVGNFVEGCKAGHALQNLFKRHHHIRTPHPALFQRHELDEAHRDLLLAGKTAKGFHLVLVEAAQKHAVDLHRPQPHLPGRANPFQYLLVAALDARDAGKALRIHGVHADGDAPQPSLPQWHGHDGQQMPVGGQRQLRSVALGGAQRGQLADQLQKVVAQQRLAASQANLGDAQADEDPRHAQIVRHAEFGKLGAVLSRAAVHAAVVTSVGDGDS